MNKQGIPCGRNSSYSFIPILSKLDWCFGHGEKICLWFGYYPQIIFCYFFLQVELSHFSGIIYNKVHGKGIPCGCKSSYSFKHCLLKLHWCFGHGLKICMWLRYNPRIIFYYFFCKLNLAIFPALSIIKWMDRRYLVVATRPTVFTDSFETWLVFWSWSEDMHVVCI